jgi:hypothetical protein
MVQLLIVNHSKTGGSRQMAEVAYSTACEDVTTILKLRKRPVLRISCVQTVTVRIVDSC